MGPRVVYMECNIMIIIAADSLEGEVKTASAFCLERHQILKQRYACDVDSHCAEATYAR